MNIRLLNRDSVDVARWDAAVMASPQPSVFAVSWYLDAVFPNWQALVMDDYTAVSPVFPQRKWGISYHLQPLFSREAAVYGTEDSGLIQAIGDALKSRFLLAQMGWPAGMEAPQGWRSRDRIYQRLELGQGENRVVEGYSSNAVRLLKKLGKEPVEFAEPGSPEDIIALFRAEKGHEFAHLNDAMYARLQRLMQNALDAGCGRMVGISMGSEWIAAGFFIDWNHRLLFLKGAVSERGKAVGAMYGIFDHVIRQYAESRVCLDFGGSDNEGLAAFNRKFGAQDIHYLILTHNSLPWPLSRWAAKRLTV
jgi:hypothetical protein